MKILTSEEGIQKKQMVFSVSRALFLHMKIISKK